ncbi:MAG: hypothetical protein K6T91_11545 [Firmicutes bacterium]|nr:hypothetical protein [Bacillota bacterium]
MIIFSRVRKASTLKAKSNRNNTRGNLKTKARIPAAPLLLLMICSGLVKKSVILIIRDTKVNKTRNQIDLRFVLKAVIAKPTK